MPELKDEQVEFIWADIRKRGVFTESLAENLLDHICCFLEEQPDDGRPFAEMYKLALNSFGKNGLQEVQDETLFLIHQKQLSKMKKLMYITGTIASISLIVGALFKLMHWPGANMMLLLGTLSLTFFFSPFFFYIYFKEQTEKKGKAIAIFGFLTGIFLCLGAIFKLLHWPGASFMIIGFVLLFIIFLPLYVINGMRNPLTRFGTISNGFLLACIGGFMMLLSFQNPSKAVEDSYKTIHENENAMLNQLKQNWKLNGDSSSNALLNEFTTACDNAIAEIPENEGSNKIGSGAPMSPQDLEDLNTKISRATNNLNLYSGFKQKLNFTPIAPAQSGSIRYQILQHECEAYLLAMNGKK